ncbi:hypothetical protein SCLCIDRAFT_560868 [Scleroderma citrinum Foug A]|uniref:Uncharacterized protein n=1 Tax=Scleroderma citrinum Foug A TaxID=1036808 RepID=A0A0C3DWY7_9AGAM|nr:hypothetical protein SCLCIDRAFT_560868 [Scleroderma citrinum Foug A]
MSLQPRTSRPTLHTMPRGWTVDILCEIQWRPNTARLNGTTCRDTYTWCPPFEWHNLHSNCTSRTLRFRWESKRMGLGVEHLENIHSKKWSWIHNLITVIGERDRWWIIKSQVPLTNSIINDMLGKKRRPRLEVFQRLCKPCKPETLYSIVPA